MADEVVEQETANLEAAGTAPVEPVKQPATPDIETHKGIQRTLQATQQENAKLRQQLDATQGLVQRWDTRFQTIEDDMATIFDTVRGQGAIESEQTTTQAPSRLAEVRKKRGEEAQAEAQRQQAMQQAVQQWRQQAEARIKKAGMEWADPSVAEITSQWDQNPIEAYNRLLDRLAEMAGEARRARPKASPAAIEAETTLPTAARGSEAKWKKAVSEFNDNPYDPAIRKAYMELKRERGL